MTDGGWLDPGDLTVVIPARPRSRSLDRVLSGLASQTVGGFTTIVITEDGDRFDGGYESLIKTRALSMPRWTRAGALNTGVEASETDLVLLLDDDVVPYPDVIKHHLDEHRRHPETEVAVIGRVVVDTRDATDPVHRWAAASGIALARRGGTKNGPVRWSAFQSANVSLKRQLLDAAGGFDPNLAAFEDLDAGWRLAGAGMVLVPAAQAVSRQVPVDETVDLRARLMAVGRGERAMASRYPWFVPEGRRSVLRALSMPRVPTAWPLLVDRVRPRPAFLQKLADAKVNDAYLQRLGPWLLNGWDGERALEELRTYLGEEFEERLLTGHQQAVDAEEAAAPDEATFYRTSRAYLYDLTAFSLWDTKIPYLEALCRFVPPGGRILDYGCGIGSDGLRLLDRGYRVEFADFANPSVAYLHWRLERRQLEAPVHDLDRGVPGGFDGAFSFDVIEHVDDPFGFLDALESRAEVVAVNFLEPDPADTHLHRPLPIDRLLDHCAARGLLWYRRHHGRSHLVVYRHRRGRTAVSRLRRVLGSRLAT